jgi:hypothetical protein
MFDFSSRQELIISLDALDEKFMRTPLSNEEQALREIQTTIDRSFYTLDIIELELDKYQRQKLTKTFIEGVCNGNSRTIK